MAIVPYAFYYDQMALISAKKTKMQPIVAKKQSESGGFPVPKWYNVGRNAKEDMV